jgi:hypothetical protein
MAGEKAKPASTGIRGWLHSGPLNRANDRRLCFNSNPPTLYVSVPKTGCTTIKTILAAASGLIGAESTHYRHSEEFVHDVLMQSADRWSNKSLIERKEILRGQNTFRFTSVRNPFERIVSCYLDKVVANPTYWKKQIGTSGSSFKEFLAAIRDTPPGRRDVHTALMADICFPRQMSFDFIVRHETFASDLEGVRWRLGLGEYQLPRPRRDQESRAKIGEFIGPQEADLIRKIYARDFEAFNYPLDVPT